MRKTSKLKNIGQAPGTLIYTGDRFSQESKINIIDYNGKEVMTQKIADDNALGSINRHFVKWIDLVGVNNIEKVQKIGEIFGIHPLILEDIVNTEQRPKIEEIEDDYIYISLKMFDYHKNDERKLLEEQISLVLGKHYVLSFQENENDDFDVLKERINNGKGKIRKMGSDYLAYSIIDSVVDNYFVVLEGIEDDVEDLQDELMDNPTNSTLSKIQKLKQDLITLRKSIWPVREIINALLKLDSNLLSDDLQTYLKDLYDHTIQVIDAIETFKDIIGGSLDIYLSSLSNKLNEVMKVLTIIGTIFIPLTFVTGFFGMNFKFMMVIDHPFLLPIVIASMCMIAFGMLVYFRRKKWI